MTSEALLRFLLEVLQPLCGGPAAQPLAALRLLLTCAAAASQEAGMELLAYELVEEVGLGAQDFGTWGAVLQG